MRRERRIAVAVLGIVAIVAVIWFLRGRGDGDDADSEDGSGRSGRIDPRTGKPIIDVHAVGDRRIAGVVMLDGSPVAGAGVLIGTRAGQRKLITDAAGTFDFGMVKADKYTVFAEKPKLMPVARVFDLRTPAIESEHLVLVLHACDASIHGTVRDSGGPIAKAHVGISEDMNEPLGGVDSDDQGAYELCISPDGSGVVVDADGYARVTDFISASGRFRRDFLLVPEAVVTGRVVRAADKVPVPGALVEVISSDFSRGRSMRSVAADDEGRFRVDGLAPGRYTATATADRMATVEPTDVIAEVGKGDPIVCSLVVAVTISGKVVDADQQGVAGITVTASDRVRRGAWRTAVSAPDGSFELDHVVPGEYTVGLPRAFSRNRGDGDSGDLKQIAIKDADVRDVVIVAGKQSSISGRVLYEGKPVDGVLIRANSTSAATEHDGRFELRGLEPGPQEIYAESKRLGAFTRGPKITLAANEQRTGVDLVLDLAGSIAGVVVDQSDKPISGAFLAFSLLSGTDFGQATTDEAGRFRAGALSGGGDYLYEVRIGGQGGTILPPVEGRRNPPVAVADGRTHVADVRVRVRYERLAIAGKVQSSRGDPVPDAQIRVARAIRGSWDGAFATSDAGGAFTINDLTTGNYKIVVTTPRATASVAEVAAGRKDVVIKLADPGSIEGTLVGFPSPPEITVYGGNDRGPLRATVTGTTFAVRDVPPGRYQILAHRRDDPPASARVEVKSGEVARATLTGNTEVGTVVGTVVDKASRQPVADLNCSIDGAGKYVRSDATGAIRFERARVGPEQVSCYGKAGYGFAQVTVIANQTVTVEVQIDVRRGRTGYGHAGLTLDDKLGEVIVEEIESGGPAARAGIQVGDTLLQVDGVDVNSSYDLRLIESKGPGVMVKLKIEHADKERVVELKLDPDKRSTDQQLLDGDD